MEELFRSVVTVSLTMSVILLPLLLLTPKLQNRYTSRTLWAVFLVAALRLTLPVDVSLPHPVLTVEAPAQTVSFHRPESVPDKSSPSQNNAPVERPVSLSVFQIGGVIWLSGMVLLLVWRLVSYLLARRALFRAALPSGRVENVPVWVHPMVKSPMVVGLFRPAICLPHELTEEGRQMALCHELCHIKRHDVAYKALFLWVSCVHWFNPLVWWLSRAAGRNVELCCDDDVLRGKDKAFRRQYGEVLLTMAAGRDGPALSTQFGGSMAEMKKRLSNLFLPKKNSRILVISVLLCTLLAGMLVACRPQQEEAAHPLDALQESISYHGGELSFTLPEGEEAWNILIYGRMESEEMGGMSLHYLDVTDWTPGESYSFALSRETAASLTELTMDVWVEEEEKNIDLLDVVKEQADIP